MEVEETFVDAQECFSDEENLPQYCISTGVRSTRDDGLNLSTLDLDKMLQRETCGWPTFSETCCSSCKIDATHTNKIHGETVPRKSAAVPREGNAGANSCACKHMQRTGFGESQEECILNQFVTEPRFPDCINSWSCKDLAACSCSALRQTGTLDNLKVVAHLGIVCRASISFDYPVKLKTRTEFLFGSSKLKKKVMKNVNDANNLIVPNMRLADLRTGYNLQKNVTISPVGRWIINHISQNGKVLDNLRTPLFIDLTDQDKSIMPDGSSPIETKATSFSGSDSFVVGSQDASLHAQAAESMNREECSGDTFLSFSSSKTTVSYQSNLPSCLASSRGFLQCIWEGGIPHFVFSLDDQRKVYLADPWRVESSEDKGLDWIYLFHVKGSDQEKQIIGVGCDLEIVGRMKVSSSLSFDYDNASKLKFIETEYVLFGVSNKHDEELRQALAHLKPIPKKTKGVQKMVTDIFKIPHVSKQRTRSNLIPSSSICHDFGQTFCPYRQANFSNLPIENLLMGLLVPNHEIAAMTVTIHIDQKSIQESAIGGWGLKFLKKREVEDSSFPHNGNKSIQKCKDKSISNMTMIVPEDFHGGPHGEPSSLLERWRSGGRCDCGGWDIGCPITVLDDRSCNKERLSHAEPEEECESFDLFMKGTRQNSPVLKMVNIGEGLYFIHFQSTLSALQSFSMAVAMIHSKSPSLFSKMYNT